MRKYLIGLVAGVCLTITATSYADDISDLIGKKIENTFPVYVNLKEVEAKAVVIDGTSYLPVRSIGNAIGYEVFFDETKRVVALNYASVKRSLEDIRSNVESLKNTNERSKASIKSIDERLLTDENLKEEDKNILLENKQRYEKSVFINEVMINKMQQQIDDELLLEEAKKNRALEQK
ncbi:stalk domain-containing protein [Paenibacillus koleovorans]|uniref:stalk domain-containing protein n=1 Tax=Paenibacillus koleovorans TaxID=121608 RepID=UPI000FDB59E0|nr:hypothetical protein [Paenibacillus koleovorans]